MKSANIQWNLQINFGINSPKPDVGLKCRAQPETTHVCASHPSSLCFASFNWRHFCCTNWALTCLEHQAFSLNKNSSIRPPTQEERCTWPKVQFTQDAEHLASNHHANFVIHWCEWECSQSSQVTSQHSSACKSVDASCVNGLSLSAQKRKLHFPTQGSKLLFSTFPLRKDALVRNTRRNALGEEGEFVVCRKEWDRAIANEQFQKQTAVLFVCTKCLQFDVEAERTRKSFLQYSSEKGCTGTIKQAWKMLFADMWRAQDSFHSNSLCCFYYGVSISCCCYGNLTKRILL